MARQKDRHEADLIAEIVLRELGTAGLDAICIIGEPNVFSPKPADQVHCAVVTDAGVVISQMYVEYTRRAFRATGISIHDRRDAVIEARGGDKLVRNIINVLGAAPSDAAPFDADFDDAVPWIWCCELKTVQFVPSDLMEQNCELVELCKDFRVLIENTFAKEEGEG